MPQAPPGGPGGQPAPAGREESASRAAGSYSGAPGGPAPAAAAADTGGVGAAGSAAQARAAAGMTGSPAPAAAAGQEQTYSVQPGDTLWALAGRFYGEPTRARWLAEWNGIRDPNLIRVGQVIRLPSAGEKRPGGK